MIRSEVLAFPGRATGRPSVPVEREHSWAKCILISSGISMCIAVDILQHSMPLAFLPSVLEDEGHSVMEIASALGVYYWTGFLGCSLITSFQVWRMFYQEESNDSADTDYATVQRYIKYLIVALGVGAATLLAQAMRPSWSVHFACRFVQGFAGAFIFFYTALLNVALFMDKQQDVAVTMAAIALNVAEVVGSFLGAVFFEVWGQSSVFYFLAVVSVVNQVLLCVVMYMINPCEVPSRRNSSRTNSHRDDSLRNTPRRPPYTPSNNSPQQQPLINGTPRTDKTIPCYTPDGDAGGGPVQPLQQGRMCCGFLPPAKPGAVQQLKGIFSHPRLACAVMLISMGAVVKGAVEEMLPFHADHRWDYDPMMIGNLFLIVAIAFILSAVFACSSWDWLGRYQVQFSAYWLLMLGFVAWLVFAVVMYFKDVSALGVALAAYGVCLGLTHTPANLLSASVIDSEKGAAKDAANGIFQTMWEAGGSLGFLLGGLLGERYHEQMGLLTGCAIACAVTACAMFAISAQHPDDMIDKTDDYY